ncbi:MAG: LruC domain-containing protein [Bacteroidota bacterium]
MTLTKRFLLLFALAYVATSCTLDIPEPELDPNFIAENMDDLRVPDGFDFQMDKQQEVTLVALRDGTPLKGVVFSIYDAPVNNGGNLLAYGTSNEEGKYNATLTINAAAQELYAYTTYGDYVPTQIIPVQEGAIAHTWGSGAEIPNANRVTLGGQFYCETGFYQVIQNTLKRLDVGTKTYVTVGSASENYNGIGYNVEDNYIYGYRKVSSSEIRLWKVGDDGVEEDLGELTNYTFSNAYKADFDTSGNLWAPVLTGGNWFLTKTDVDASPLTTTTTTLTQLNSVDNMHDMAFNPTLNVFFGLTQSGKLAKVDHVNNTIQTIADYNSFAGNGAFGAVWCNVNGDVYFSQNATGKIFHITMDSQGNPTGISEVMVGDVAGNNDGASCPLATAPFDDSDSDEVVDGIDAFPFDPTLAYATYLPGKRVFGTLAFEDQWPSRGDYDFNDVVLDYNYELARDLDNNIVRIIAKYKVRAAGAGFKNGFGISLEGLTPSQIASVSGTQNSSISVASNGCETGQSKAVIIVTDDVHTVMGGSPGRFINTSTGGLSRPEVDMTITIELTNPLADAGLINPFIFARGQRGYEIHLMNYPPTDQVDNTLFGTINDQSNAGSDIYYKDANGKPWGLNFISRFTYPIEKTEIISAYPEFSPWVSSGGASNTDWYGSGKGQTAKLFQ